MEESSPVGGNEQLQGPKLFHNESIHLLLDQCWRESNSDEEVNVHTRKVMEEADIVADQGCILEGQVGFDSNQGNWVI